VIAAWSVDRLGRRLQDLLGFLLELQSKNVDLYLHQQALDTSTPMGKVMLQMCGVFAELERSIIQERVRAGLERAWAKGTTLGRPRGPIRRSRPRSANSQPRAWARAGLPGHQESG
jgi:DNA invertase Pin-like site-specific DNA recombinase